MEQVEIKISRSRLKERSGVRLNHVLGHGNERGD